MTLVAEKLSKSFGDNLVFKDISFTVDKGEILVIRGRSGQGKTTLLRCINYLEVLDKGSISINGKFLCKEVNGKIQYVQKQELTDIRQEIGLVFQNFNLFPHMSVKENLLLAPKFLNNISEDKMIKRAKELLFQMDIADKEDSYPYQLSGGQQQRVAIARACMLNPSVLCFDEPTSALDDETRGQISKIIKDLANQGMAIVVVTHDNSLVEELDGKVLTLEKQK